MMKTLKIGLIGFVLGAAVAVGAATVGSEETVAAPCCSQCQDACDSCIAACGDNSVCMANCANQYSHCFSVCDFSC